MDDRQLVELFLCYHRKGDAQALGQVFDQAAPELLAVAGHLAQGPVQAEDLVQETFLAAIEQAERFDARRSLLPWLVGILVIQARRARRSLVRDSQHPTRNERTVPEPAQAARTRELEEALHGAIETLPSKYAEVLRRHLVRGQEPSEIARETGLAPGTVRVQMHRGLELLRRALPPGFAFGAVSATLGTRGLAAVRAKVVHCAAANAGTSIAGASITTSIGVLLMKKPAVVVAGVLAIAIAAAWVGLADGLKGAIEPGDWAVDATQGTILEPEMVDVEPGPEFRNELQLAPQDRGGAARTESGAAVHGFATWEETGLPAADIRVRVETRRSRGGPLDTQELHTGPAGEFRAGGMTPGNIWVQGDRGGLVIEHVEEGETVEVQLVIPRGLDVTGSVVDRGGRAVSDAEVWLSLPWRYNVGCVATKTDSAGRFRLRSVSRNCAVGARHRGYSPSWSEIVGSHGAGPSRSVEIEITLGAPSGVVAGYIVDEAGDLVAGAEVRMGNINMSGRVENDGTYRLQPPYVATMTEEDGSFQFDNAPAGKWPISARAEGLSDWRGDVVLTSGHEESLRIVLQKPVTVRGVVLDAQGAPVEGAEVAARHVSHFAGGTIKTDASGAYALVDVVPGKTALVASSDRGNIEEWRFAFPGEELEWNPVLPQLSALRGVALDEEGQPLDSWVVFASPTQLLDGRYWAATDADGRFEIPNAHAGSFRLELRESMDWGQVALACLEGVRPESAGLVLQLSEHTAATAWIEGRIRDARGNAVASAKLRAECPGRMGSVSANLVAGAFRIGPLSPGCYQITAEPTGAPRRFLGAHTVGPGQTLQLGDLTLSAPGSLAARVLGADGLELQTQLRDERGELWVTCTEGQLVTGQQLPQGAYRLALRAYGLATQTRVINVAAGEETELDIPMGWGREVALTMHLPEGEAYPAEVVIEMLDGQGARVALRTESVRRGQRSIEITETLPPGRVRFLVEGRHEPGGPLICHALVDLVLGKDEAAAASVEAVLRALR